MSALHKYHVKKCLEAGLTETVIFEVTKKTKQICNQAIEIMTSFGMESRTEILIGLATSYYMNSTVLFEMFLTHAANHEIGEQQRSELIGFIGGGRITRIILQAIKNKNAQFDSMIVFDPVSRHATL